jgi:hypothetical protein
MTRVHRPVAASSSPSASIPNDIPVPARRARVRLLAALGSMAVVAGGLSVAAAPAALAVANSVVVSSFDAGPIGVSGTLTFTPAAAAGYLNLTLGFPASEYTTGWTTGDCASNGITVAINGVSLIVACGIGVDGAYKTIVAYNYWSSPPLTATDVITMTWGSTAANRTGASSAAPFQVTTSTPASYTPVTPTLAGSTPAVPAAPAAPAMPAAPAGPVEPPPPAPQSLPPVAGVAPAAEVPPGASSGSVNGAPVTTTVTVNPAGGVQVAGGGSTVALADLGPDGLPLSATGGGLAGAPGGGLSVKASGFLPQSQADVYMYSEQLWLGKATVDAGGNVSMSLIVPSWVTPGGHTLQFVGYQGPYTSIALSTGITVAAPAAQVVSAQPASGEFTAHFRRGSADLAPAARAGIRSAVSAAAKARAGATVTCTATHLEPASAQAGTLWVRREAAVNVFLSYAGCDTVALAEGAVVVASGQPGLAIRVAVVAG